MGSSSKLVDFHAHFLTPEVMREAAPRWILSGFGTRPFAPPEAGSPRARQTAAMLDPALQLAEMDVRGIDVFALSAATAVQGTDWAESAHQAELERRNNE